MASPARAAVPSITSARFDDADAAARQVERVLGHQARVLGGLAADQRAAGVAAAGRDRADQLRHRLGDDVPDRDVVEEGERLRPAADDVVGAHRDEVDADRVEALERRGDGGLGPDPVGRGDEQRLAVAGRDRERPAEAAEAADDLGPAGRLDVRPHQVDRPVAGRDVDSGRAVRVAPAGSLGTGRRHAGRDRLLEHELAARGVVRDRIRVVAVEAGEAEPLVGQLERGQHAADRQVAERIGADELADLGLACGSTRSARSRSGCRCRRSTGGRSAAR